MNNNNNLLQVLSPFGEWKHSKGNQIVDEIAAKKMIHNSQKLFAKKIPIYIGHPDENNAHCTDKKVGEVERILKTPKGILISARYNNDSYSKIKTGKISALSPRWEMEHINDNNYRPIRLISVGLTNNPNISTSGKIIDVFDISEQQQHKILLDINRVKNCCSTLINKTKQSNKKIEKLITNIRKNNVIQRISEINNNNYIHNKASLKDLSEEAKKISQSSGEAYTKVFARLRNKTKNK